MPTLRNKDEMNETQTAIAQRIANAAREGNTEDFELGLQDLFQNINDQILASAQSVGANADAAVLARRGVRQLTNEETKFYNTFIEAARSNKGNPMMALTGADKTFPTTIIEQVMEDMQQSHPLRCQHNRPDPFHYQQGRRADHRLLCKGHRRRNRKR